MSSTLPKDDTPTFGSSYGLNGYQFYEDYNSGVEDGARLPQTRGFSGLPDGKIDPSASNEDLYRGLLASGKGVTIPEITQGAPHLSVGNLGGMLTANTIGGPVDLSWLEVEQDPARLPESVDDKVLKGIQKSWSERTNGRRITLNYNSQERHQILEEIPEIPVLRLASYVRSTMRRSARGDTLDSIIEYINQKVGHNPKAVEALRPAMKNLGKEHGLAGKVFIRAVAYLGCHDGSWAGELSKFSGAKYVVADDKCANCVHNRKKRCDILQKELVASVPWDDALQYYGRKLKASGIQILASGDSRRDLKAALCRKVLKKEPVSALPTHKPFKTVSVKEAMKVFAAVKPSPRKVLKPDIKGPLLKKACAQIDKWVASSQITAKQAAEIKKETNPKVMISKGAALITKSTVKTYDGAVFQPSQVETKTAKVPVKDVYFALRVASQLMSQGLYGSALDKEIQNRISNSVLVASADKMAALRADHEGLSGDRYIHASAFSAGTRDEGCLEGAAKVANTTAKHVMAMSQCGGCIKNSQGTCGVYRRKLVSSCDDKAYQTQKLASGKKVSLNVYDNGLSRVAASGSTMSSYVNPVVEFGLNGSHTSLDNIEFDKEPEKTMDYSDFSFGGMLF